MAPPPTTTPSKSTSAACSLAIRSERQKLRSTIRSKSRNRSRFDSLPRNASGEGREEGGSDRCIGNSNSGDDKDDEGEQVVVMEVDRNNKKDHSSQITASSVREDFVTNSSGDTENNMAEAEIMPNDIIPVLTNMEFTEVETNQKNESQCSDNREDYNKDDCGGDNVLSKSSDMKIDQEFTDDEKSSSPDDDTDKMDNQSSNDVNSVIIISCENKFDSSYNTRNILNDPPPYFSKHGRVNDNHSNKEYDDTPKGGDIEGEERNTNIIDELDQKMSEESLLDVHSIDEESNANNIPQRERINLYYSYVADSDSDDHVNAQESNVVDDDIEKDREESDSESDDDDTDTFKQYACLDENEEEKFFDFESVTMSQLPESGFAEARPFDDGDNECFAQFEDQQIQTANDAINIESNSNVESAAVNTNESTSADVPPGSDCEEARPFEDGDNECFAQFEDQQIQAADGAINIENSRNVESAEVENNAMAVDEHGSNSFSMPPESDCEEARPLDDDNDKSLTQQCDLVEYNSVKTDIEKINYDFELNFDGEWTNNFSNLKQEEADPGSHECLNGFDNVADGSNGDKNEVLNTSAITNETDSSTGSDFYFTLNSSNLQATLSSILESKTLTFRHFDMPPPHPPPPLRSAQQVKKTNPPLPPSMEKRYSARNRVQQLLTPNASLSDNLPPPPSSLIPEQYDVQIEKHFGQNGGSKVQSAEMSILEDAFTDDLKPVTLLINQATSCNHTKTEENATTAASDCFEESNEKCKPPSNDMTNDGFLTSQPIKTDGEPPEPAFATEHIDDVDRGCSITIGVVPEPIEYEFAPNKQRNDSIATNVSEKSAQQPINKVVQHSKMFVQDQEAQKLLIWIEKSIMLELGGDLDVEHRLEVDTYQAIRTLLAHESNFNALCSHVSKGMLENLERTSNNNNETSCSDHLNKSLDVSIVTDVSTDVEGSRKMEKAAISLLQRRQKIDPYSIPTVQQSANTTAANFVSFLQKLSFMTGIETPFDGNPFLLEVLRGNISQTHVEKSFLLDVVCSEDSKLLEVLKFMYKISYGGECEDIVSNEDMFDGQKDSLSKIYDAPYFKEEPDFNLCQVMASSEEGCITPAANAIERKQICSTTKRNNKTIKPTSLELLKGWEATLSSLYCVPPDLTPSPFETSIWQSPNILIGIMSWLGDPTVVCRMNCVNRFCNRVISENEYKIMKNAVRVGGIDNHMRPRFWLWITLEKCKNFSDQPLCVPGLKEESALPKTDLLLDDFNELERRGRESQWHHIIERDVPRAFGNMPPHKAKSHRKSNSIVKVKTSVAC